MLERIPENPVQFIKKCVREGNIHWTYHVNMRMRRRHIPRISITEALDTYEIIEEYPDDKYLPSYLVYAQHDHMIFHLLFAIDTEGNNVRVVTAYIPDPCEWDDVMKRRRH